MIQTLAFSRPLNFFQLLHLLCGSIYSMLKKNSALKKKKEKVK